MEDAPILRQNGQTVTPWPTPMPLVLSVPAGRTIASADLSLKSVSEAVTDTSPAHLRSDLGDLREADAVRWLSAVFDGETTIVSLTIRPAPAGPAPVSPPVAARVKVLSGGVWTPLAPVDVVALGVAQTFPPVVASQILAELLVQPAGAPVPLPGAAHIAGVTLQGTPQPGHVAVAVGEDAPFFTHAGPLPVAGVNVPGLARAAGRFLLDHTGATEVPLRLSAAGKGSVQLVFSGALDPPPPPPPDSRGGRGGAGVVAETVYLDVAAPALAAAQLCDAGHVVAQGFAALPAGAALSSFDVLVRGPGVSGTLAIHADQGGRPAEAPLAGGTLPFAIDPALPNAAGWVAARPASPLALPDPWWLVCSATQGECLWYAAPAPPAGKAVGRLLARLDGGAWAPAPAAPTGWAQIRLRTLPAPAAPG